MSERQAKRLRRAARAYIKANRHKLDRGAPVHEQAAARAGIVRELWPRCNHHVRGVVGARLAGGTGRASRRYFVGRDRVYTIPSHLDGALRALGVVVRQ